MKVNYGPGPANWQHENRDQINKDFPSSATYVLENIRARLISENPALVDFLRNASGYEIDLFVKATAK